MALITFENLPSTNTPINAENLNNNFNELDSGISALDTKIDTYNQVTLWTNPSPTSSFAGQQITLNDSLENYNYIEVLYKRSANSTQYGVSGRIPKGYDFQVNMSSNYFYWRTVAINSNTKITFGDCRYFTSYGLNPDSTQNSTMIPYKVFGYKH